MKSSDAILTVLSIILLLSSMVVMGETILAPFGALASGVAELVRTVVFQTTIAFGVA